MNIPDAVPRARRSSRDEHPFWWLLPVGLLMAVFYLYPVAEVVRISFTNATLLDTAYSYTLDSYRSVLTDLGLPGINGYEVARRLRQTPTGATIPIYAISGYARDKDRLEAMSAGFTEHFAKPINLTELEHLVELS